MHKKWILCWEVSLVKILCAGKRKGFNGARGLLSKAWRKLLKEQSRFCLSLKMSEVFLQWHSGEAIKTIINYFEKLDYHVVYNLLTAADYGVTQRRERVIVGTRKDKLPAGQYPKPTLGKKNWISLKNKQSAIWRERKRGKWPIITGQKAKKNKGQGNSVVSANKPGPTMRTEHHGNIEYHWNEKGDRQGRHPDTIIS